ncbi:MAG: hypothetical protein ACFHVJ_10075 [Aestuariibacter sp.]
MMEHITLLSSGERFAVWVLKDMPYLSALFDLESMQYKPEKVDEFFDVASQGQKIMAQFVLGVWLGDNKFNFDFTEAAAHLNEKEIQIVTGWMKKPFWP